MNYIGNINYIERAILLRNERIRNEENVGFKRKLTIDETRNEEIHDVLVAFLDLIISFGSNINVCWSDGLPCLRLFRKTLFAYYSLGEYFLDVNSKSIGKYKSISELMAAVTLEVSKR